MDIIGYPNFQGILMSNGEITTFGKIFNSFKIDHEEEEGIYVWSLSKTKKLKKCKVLSSEKSGNCNKLMRITTLDGSKVFSVKENKLLTSKGFKKVSDITIDDEIAQYNFDTNSLNTTKILTVTSINYEQEEDLFKVSVDSGNNLLLLGGFIISI